MFIWMALLVIVTKLPTVNNETRNKLHRIQSKWTTIGANLHVHGCSHSFVLGKCFNYMYLHTNGA